MDSIQNTYKAAKVMNQVRDVGNSFKEKASKASSEVKLRTSSKSSSSSKKEPMLEKKKTKKQTTLEDDEIRSQKSIKSDSTKGSANGGSETKQIIYLFTARDADMIVFELHVDKNV